MILQQSSESLEMFFLYGFLIHYAMLFLWFGLFISAKSFVLGIHSKMFGMPEEKLIPIHYGGMGLLKLIAFSFYLIPYICLKLI